MAVSGIGQADAYVLVAEVARAMRKRALGFFVVGGIAVLVGLLVTFATLQRHSPEADAPTSCGGVR